MDTDHRLTIRIVLQEPISDLEATTAGGLAVRALIDAGYPVETHAAHLGDPLPADPAEDLARDGAWILRGRPAVGLTRAAGG